LKTDSTASADTRAGRPDRVRTVRHRGRKAVVTPTGRPGLDHVLSTGFQDGVRATTRRWDKEWLRYFSMENKAYYSYFRDLSHERKTLSLPPEGIRSLTAEAFYHADLFKGMKPHIWLPGDLLVSKVVLEMGCGPGYFGRLAGRFAEAYIGLDASRLAISIARLTSPKRCSYLHLGDARKLARLAKSVDVCVSRHFFIHHNYADSLWILNFLRDVTKPGGTIQADFNADPAGQDRLKHRKAADALDKRHASAVFDFSDEEIARIAAESGLDLQRIEYRPELKIRFATFRVR
jgi:SAM-dependent methyltransferase